METKSWKRPSLNATETSKDQEEIRGDDNEPKKPERQGCISRRSLMEDQRTGIDGKRSQAKQHKDNTTLILLGQLKKIENMGRDH